jgi:uracil-DNA glycosylase family 4
MDGWPKLTQDIVTCRACPRLVAYREAVARTRRRAFRDQEYWGRPVPGFGDRAARLVLVGLAPAAHGANRTGRMFTGDRSGDFLFAALHRAGFSNQSISVSADDGLVLTDAYVFSIVRCAPPGNKPSPQEIANCAPFLGRELDLLTEAKVYLCLGEMAWRQVRRAFRERGAPLTSLAFGHGQVERLPSPWPSLVASYHPSQQNTQTGRLTASMMDDVLRLCRSLL